MKITNRINNNQSPAFRGAIFLNMSALEKERALPVVAELKKVIGQGFKQKMYKIGQDTFIEDVFIGYNKGKNPYTEEDSYGILIATGCNSDPGGALFAKLAQVDAPILKKINKVLEKFNLINNPQVGLVKSSPSDFSGAVNKFDDGLDVVLSRDFISDLDKDFIERTGYYYHDSEEVLGKNIVFNYQKTRKNVYKHKYTIVL